MSEAAVPADSEELPEPVSRWSTVQPWLTLLVRLGLAGIFGVAGYLKVVDPAGAVQSVQAYQLFPPELAQIIGYALPFAELALALLLVIGLAPRLVAVASALVLLAFIGGIISAWAKGLSIDCGCFGTGGKVKPGEERYLEDILRDVGFLALAAWIYLWPRSKFSLDG